MAGKDRLGLALPAGEWRVGAGADGRDQHSWTAQARQCRARAVAVDAGKGGLGPVQDAGGVHQRRARGHFCGPERWRMGGRVGQIGLQGGKSHAGQPLHPPCLRRHLPARRTQGEGQMPADEAIGTKDQDLLHLCGGYSQRSSLASCPRSSTVSFEVCDRIDTPS